MESDSSDLTEYSDDREYEYDEPKATTSRKTAKSKGKASGKSSYEIRNVLRVPRATTYTAQALYDQIYDGYINLEPEYQRDVVWPESKQIGIIDSIFRNFYIPPIIFAVNNTEDGTENRTCIDGKQRLTSIHKFMDGIIPHKDTITGEKLWYKSTATPSRTSGPSSSYTGSKSTRPRKLLPDKYRRMFANKQIVCVEYQDITDGDEREIFQRVQLGMALTPAEKLQVISTSRASFIRALQAAHLKDENGGGLGGDALEWDRSRGSDFRCLSNAIWCIEKWFSGKSGEGSGLKNAGTILQLEKWLLVEDDLDDAFKERVEDTFAVFEELVEDRELGRLFKTPTKVSPIEFILIALLIAVLKDHLTRKQLAERIGDMRREVREEHRDIRMNTRVSKTMIDFIGRVRKEVAGGGGGKKRKRDGDGDVVMKSDEEEERGKVKLKKERVSVSPKKPIPRPRPTPAGMVHPPTDRIAALRAAKNAFPPLSPTTVKNEPIPTPTGTPIPGQFHQSSSSSAASAATAAAASPNLPLQPTPTPSQTAAAAQLEGLLMGMMRQQRPPAPAPAPPTAPRALMTPSSSAASTATSFPPPPPLSASSSGGIPIPIPLSGMVAPPPDSAGSSASAGGRYARGSGMGRYGDERDVAGWERERSARERDAGYSGRGRGEIEGEREYERSRDREYERDRGVPGTHSRERGYVPPVTPDSGWKKR